MVFLNRWGCLDKKAFVREERINELNPTTEPSFGSYKYTPNPLIRNVLILGFTTRQLYRKSSRGR